jgi:uncharacterized protein YjiS (DUF1127 family)
MTTNERFDETPKAVTFMGLDVVTDWFGEAVAPVLVTAFEKTGRLITGIVDAVKARHDSRVMYRILMALDDRMLNDIGIARADILAVAKGIER